jgi:diguanylate cyclase (GGDEF)-like protein
MSYRRKPSDAVGLRRQDDTTNTANPRTPLVSDGVKRPYLIVIGGAQVGELYKLSESRTVVGRGASANIRIVDDGISREHLELRVEGPHVSIHDLGSTNGTYHNGTRVDVAEIADGDKISIGSTTILKFSHQDGITEAYERDLYRRAVRDGLTMALKREFFLERLEGEVAFAMRHKVPLALLMFDLDDFKTINDRHGHAAGDRVLAAAAKTVQGMVRREDILCRFGGEEFALACQAAPIEKAVPLAERLRLAIADTVTESGGAELRITASFGVAVCPAEEIDSAVALIAAADTALYKAKAAGKNRTESV